MLQDAVELIKIKMELGAISVVAKLPPIIEDKVTTLSECSRCMSYCGQVMIDLPMGLQRHQLVGKLLGPKCVTAALSLHAEFSTTTTLAASPS